MPVLPPPTIIRHYLIFEVAGNPSSLTLLFFWRLFHQLFLLLFVSSFTLSLPSFFPKLFLSVVMVPLAVVAELLHQCKRCGGLEVARRPPGFDEVEENNACQL